MLYNYVQYVSILILIKFNVLLIEHYFITVALYNYLHSVECRRLQAFSLITLMPVNIYTLSSVDVYRHSV